jgi:hypothetical protein
MQEGSLGCTPLPGEVVVLGWPAVINWLARGSGGLVAAISIEFA